MVTRKEAEDAAREAGVPDDEIENASNISEVEALTAARSGDAPPAPAESKPAKGGAITRMSAVAWWCPNCDNANERSLNACGKCGAKVSDDGKSVGKSLRV